MTKKTLATSAPAETPAPPPIPQTGGTFVVQPDGKLKQTVAGTAPPPEPTRPEKDA